VAILPTLAHHFRNGLPVSCREINGLQKFRPLSEAGLIFAILEYRSPSFLARRAAAASTKLVGWLDRSWPPLGFKRQIFGANKQISDCGAGD